MDNYHEIQRVIERADESVIREASEWYRHLGGEDTLAEVPLRRWEIRWRRALGGSPAAGLRDILLF